MLAKANVHLAELLQGAPAPSAAGARALAREGQIDAAQGDHASRGAGAAAAGKRCRPGAGGHRAQVKRGLEYPVVLVPFASAFRAADSDDWVIERDAASGARRLSPRTGPPCRRARRRARLQEDLPALLYVALTRARHARCG
ncbi:MAG: hypothetical protein U1F49_04340 [Rubrivivax sp.]